MADSSSNVTTTIRVVGEDRASKEIKKVTQALDESAVSLKDVAERSGDSERALIGLKDVIGPALPEGFQRAADIAGGLEGIIKGMPGPLGIAGLAVTALGAAWAYLYQQEEEARQQRLKGEQDKIAALYENKVALAAELGVSLELLGVAKASLAVQERAGVMIKDLAQMEKDLAEARSEKDKEKARNLFRAIELRRQEVKELDRELAVHKQIAFWEQSQRQWAENNAKAEELWRRQVLLSMKSEKDRQLQERSFLAQDVMGIKTERLEVQNRQYESQEEKRRVLLALDERQLNLEEKLAALQDKPAKKAGKTGKTAAQLEAEASRKDMAQALADGHKLFLEEEKQRDARLTAEADLRKDMAKWDDWLTEETRKQIDERQRAQREAADKLRRDWATVASSVGRVGAAVGGKFGNAMSIAGERTAFLVQNWSELKNKSSEVISAIGAVGASFIESEQAKAAILAITEAAAAAASYPDVAGMVQHGLAAALYASAAAGFGGSASSPTAAASASSSGALKPDKSSQPAQYIINYNGGFGTKQEVGKAITDAVKSLGGTGMPAMQAA